MVFSDPLFIFAFLPIFLLVYSVVDRRFTNIYVFFASLLFYMWGEKKFVWVLLLSIILNYSVGVAISEAKFRDADAPKRHSLGVALLVAGIVADLALLIYFKYIGFFTANIALVQSLVHNKHIIPIIHQALPLGISFFTFQGISYLIDCYRGDVQPTRSLVKFATYKILFPQLIAGPIVRYAEVAREMDKRSVGTDQIFEGMRRFIVGFVKKVLLADTFASVADPIFGVEPGTLSTAAAWLGAVCYALQIYFDFSGYSDMAIGIGGMLGFHYPENFNYPYISLSIREFWRRWHMTLSFWFRDYVYRPLGGNRVGAIRTYLNLLLVFVLTGFWHGASWTFVAWGLWHGLFMMIERRFDPASWPFPTFLRRLYALGVVLFGWVLFRADSFSHAAQMIGRMLTWHGAKALHSFGEFYTPLVGITLAFGVVSSAPTYGWCAARLGQTGRIVVGTLVLGGLFIFAGTKVLSGAYSPFLYFRF